MKQLFQLCSKFLLQISYYLSFFLGEKYFLCTLVLYKKKNTIDEVLNPHKHMNF
jgi:hypothetical protein